MLNYIKEQIRARQPHVEEPVKQTPENVDDEVLLEYASLFQELADLSVEGTEADKERKFGIDIPFDDIEVETIEFDLGTGTVTDVPGDATVTNAIVESYQTMKTYDEFFQEAMSHVTRFARESNDEYDKRVAKLADKMYNEYCEDAKRIGEFGFSTISITDNSVPSKILVDFGPIEKDSDKSFMSKVKTFFATDENHRIFKKQLDSVRLVQEGAFQKIGKSLMAYMESHYDVPVGNSVWDICTPKNLIVPKGNGDSFCVVLEYTNELTGKNEFFGWTSPVNEVDENQMNSCTQFNMESFVNETQYENKDAVIQEAANTYVETKRKMRPRSRFYQEAIDFGGADNNASGDAGSDLPPVENTGDNTDTGNTSTPTIDANPTGGDNTANADQNVDASSGSDAAPADATSSEGTDDTNKETAAVNDVSSQIAEKVANQTQQQADESAPDDMGSDITFPDETGNESSMDKPSNDDYNTEEMDDTSSADNTSDIDNTSDDFATSDDVGDDTSDDFEDGEMPDLENMTIDQIIDQGTEKLKGMTMSEIKNFISSASPSEIQEAFVLTSKNINKEVDVRLRETLGVLNDFKMDINKLVRKFRFCAHRLNRVLSKAAKMTKVYSSDEIEDIQKLNRSLGNLMTVMKTNSKSASVPAIKRNIMEFTKQSKVVAAFVEEKMMTSTKPVQEAFLLNNINDKITKSLIPVKGNMEELKKLHDEGSLTRGRIIKKYSAKSSDAYAKSSNMPGGGHGCSGYSKYAINIDTALKFLNKALRKKEVDNIELISKLADKLDLISDYIETVIDDSVENKETLKRIGILSGEIIELINQFIGDDTEETSNNVEPDMNTEDTTDATPDFDNDDMPTTSEDDSDNNDDEESTDDEDDEDNKKEDEE